MRAGGLNVTTQPLLCLHGVCVCNPRAVCSRRAYGRGGGGICMYMCMNNLTCLSGSGFLDSVHVGGGRMVTGMDMTTVRSGAGQHSQHQPCHVLVPVLHRSRTDIPCTCPFWGFSVTDRTKHPAHLDPETQVRRIELKVSWAFYSSPFINKPEGKYLCRVQHL